MYNSNKQINNLQKELEKALKNLKENNNRENALALIFVAGKTLHQGIGFPSMFEFNQVLDEVYGNSV